MAKHRARIMETRYFCFIIALIVFSIFFALSAGTTLFKIVELKVLDLHLWLKTNVRTSHLQEGVTTDVRNLKISEDISIIGIDSTTLAEYGKFPFPRYHYADLLNAFSRIKKQELRERSIFLDVFFVEPDVNAADDAILMDAISKSDRTFLETVLRLDFSTTADREESWKRLQELEDRNGALTRVSGPWRKMPDHLGFEAPLQPLARAVKGYGHANFEADIDGIYRSQPLVAKISREIETIKLDDLKEGLDVDTTIFERLAYRDKSGKFVDIPTPLTAQAAALLKKKLPKVSPPLVEDLNGDGQPDSETYIVHRFKDIFIPSITLSLALDYFHKSPRDIEVVLGKHIKIPSPEKWDPESKAWKPYEVQTSADVYGADGGLKKAGKRKALPEILIPIDDQGQMAVNFMGNRSAESGEGSQTYPVRTFSAYADMVKPPDESLWRSSMASSNKILMVGAFSRGIAQDEKPTPLGLMYGIEIHANALNTMLMDNFIWRAPMWLNALILLVLVFGIAVSSSRLPSIFTLLITVVTICGAFVGVEMLFESSGLLLNFATPAIAMILSFVSIIVYRAMTEEKDKRALKATFGKYVSPEVVNQLALDPPELGGVDKDMTVFFSDIRGFSTFSENMSPQELINHLNIYLGAMTDLVLEYRGTLDKYIGDAIMAFWGAPLPMVEHAIKACECSLKQMEKLKELNAGWPPEKRLNIGIGLNSGKMVVGNVGSSLRLSYTAMGDEVNLGSRLEGTNKEYGTNIIVSESTYALAKDHFIFRELDVVRVKGKNKPVTIYELVDFK